MASSAAGADSADDHDGDEAPDDPGADHLILGQADDDRPLDIDRTSEALETDSFSDVGRVRAERGRLRLRPGGISPASLAEHLLDQLHGISGAMASLRG